MILIWLICVSLVLTLAAGYAVYFGELPGGFKFQRGLVPVLARRASDSRRESSATYSRSGTMPPLRTHPAFLPDIGRRPDRT